MPRPVRRWPFVMKKWHRLVIGYASMVFGLVLMMFAGHVTGEMTYLSATKGTTAAASAVGGGILTFVVSRRMLTSSGD